MTVAETADWIDERTRGVLTEAWHHAYLHALGQSPKTFPKSPEQHWKSFEPKKKGESVEAILATAKARLAAQESAKRRKAKGREVVIRREE